MAELLATFDSLPLDAPLFALGEFATYHHRAGVARYKKLMADYDEVGWKITQGVNASDKPDLFHNSYNWNHMRYAFKDLPQRKGPMHAGFINKTVMVWPEEGRGCVIGFIRKSIGVSVKGTHSTYHNEYDPGYHVVEMYVDLYVIKSIFRGTDYVLAPVWAVTE